MKAIVSISRILVGVLFIFSGFIKLNDPVGFSYKLQEYFSEPVLDIPFLIPFALIIAILLVIFELVVGIMLLIGYAPKFTSWSLLVMIIFFTFLTFYSAYFNKVTDCGCFGDAIPLTPWESFYKDIVLLLLILIIFFNQKYINPIFPLKYHKWVVFVSFMACFAFCYHVLMHLPVFDFRPYKIGNNIPEKMKIPEGAEQAEVVYSWKFKVKGEEKIIKNNGAYPQVDGEFIGVETTQTGENAIAPIHDFVIEGEEGDITNEVLTADKVLLIVTYNLRATEKDGYKAVKSLSEEAMKKGYKVIGLTASGPEFQSELKKEFDLNFDFYQTDETALKTIVRSNPGFLTLNNGTITQKKHWFDASDIEL
ncbi:putative membrane protein YphA (DoxX/SURF4 family) [Christiangramia gaetbulicola]|uniref:Putative membrane protein YphA (DoxX/SURF4 family) n=1 Tax=Christiangramia gaetbulicola TaxID=703340 RepID=A0A2T6AK49_9FLAO|nr:BT_3928 family protein [Christiangramia gaetbulicola]PTX44195.1 putative membrane protein YphA (DoxX/SURF4 family) [Christiangramia gaetbulicola]